MGKKLDFMKDISIVTTKTTRDLLAVVGACYLADKGMENFRMYHQLQEALLVDPFRPLAVLGFCDFFLRGMIKCGNRSIDNLLLQYKTFL